MLNLLVNLIFLIILVICLLFAGAQIIYITEVLENGLPVTAWNLPQWDVMAIWKMDYSMLVKVMTVLAILAVILTFLFKRNLFSFRRLKTRYEKENYFHLQRRYERKRGLNRIQYDRHGKITRKTLECALEFILRPLYIAQNALANYYNRPVQEKWNLQRKRFISADIEIIKTLDTCSEKEEDRHD